MANGGGSGPRLGTIVVVALSLAMLAAAIAFTWVRATLPSEPAVISADEWHWTADGVMVQPLGNAGLFHEGDIVTAIGGTPLESLLGRGAPARRPGDVRHRDRALPGQRGSCRRSGPARRHARAATRRLAAGGRPRAPRLHARPGGRRAPRLPAPARRGVASGVPPRLRGQRGVRRDLAARPPSHGPCAPRAHHPAVRARRLVPPALLVVRGPRDRVVAGPGRRGDRAYPGDRRAVRAAPGRARRRGRRRPGRHHLVARLGRVLGGRPRGRGRRDDRPRAERCWAGRSCARRPATTDG